MVSVSIAPMFPGIGTPDMEFSQTDADPSEYEEDQFLVNCGNNAIFHQLSLRIEAACLDVQPASLVRVFSPPRSFSS
jgi:hypothetical protein